ncbi:MAG: hypothetical protein FJ280_22375, partial [Planctomycetes bacterium]|nr:hypothetical protein [Planctomycetota bacterium]
MVRSDDKSTHNHPDTTGPRDYSEATRKWLDNVLAPGETETQRSADPIARNPKDVGTPGEVVQAAEVRRRRDSGPPAGTALLAGHAGGSHPPMQPAHSATDLLVSILRFKWTILIVSVLVSAPIVAAIWTQVIPQYQARAEVRVRPIIPRLVFRTEESGPIPFYDSFVNTQIALIRSPTVLQRVLDQPDVQKTKWYNDPARSYLQRLRGNALPPLERLRDGLSARPRPRTEIIDVSFTDPSVEDAKRIVTAVLEQYLKHIGEQSNAEETNLDGQLAAERASLEREIQALDNTCTDLARRLKTDAPQELISSRRARLEEVQARLTDLGLRIALLQSQQQQNLSDGNDISMIPAAGIARPSKYYEDEQWRRLDADVQRIRHQIDNSIQGPNHPGRQRAAKDLEFAAGLRQERERQLDELWQERWQSPVAQSITTTPARSLVAAGGVMAIEGQLALAKQEEELLQAELKGQQAEFTDLFTTAQSLERESR